MSDNRTVKVTLKAEIAAYVQNMLRSADATEKLGTAAAAAGSDIDRAMAQSEKATKSNQQTFTRWGTVAKASIAAVTLAAGGLFAAFVAQGVNANSFAEQNEQALTTLLGSATDAKTALDSVYNLATQTPFQFPELTKEYKNFIAAQLDLNKIIPLMHAYSGAVATLGGDSAQLGIVADAFQDMVTLGKAQGDQLNRLTEQGIPAWKLLADAAGTSVAKVQQQASEGMITADHAVDVLTKGMEKKFGGMLNNMGDTYARWQDKVASASRRTSQALTAPVVEVGKELMRSLTDVLNDSTAALSAADWDPIIKPLLKLPEMIDEIGSKISQGNVQDVIDGIGHALDLTAAAGETLYHVAVPLVEILTLAARSGMPLLDAITGILGGFNALPAPVQASVVALGLYVALQRSAFGQQAVQGVTEFVTNFKLLRQEAMFAGSSLPGVTTALAGITSGAKSAGGALLAAFGGPVGLAIAATVAVGTFAWSAWSDAQADAEAKSQASKDAIDAVTASLERNTGALGENARAVIAKQLNDAGLPKYLKDAGISADDFSAALYGNRDAQEAFRQKVAEIANTKGFQTWARQNQIDTTDMATAVESLGRFLNENKDAGKSFLGVTTGAQSVRDLTGSAGDAAIVLSMFDGQIKSNKTSLTDFTNQAKLAGDAANIDGHVNIDTSAAQARLEALSATAKKALSSFINLDPTPHKEKSSGGGGSSGDDPAVKAAKAEQKAVKKSADADTKAAKQHEEAAQSKAKSAKEAADAAEKAATEAADAYKKATDTLEKATFDWVSAQRQRQAIERTLANETDPVRQAQLSQALADATAREAEALKTKTNAQAASSAATAANTAAQANATATTQQASAAQAEYEAASAAAAAAQESASARIEAASDRLAEATEAASSRAGGAVSDFSDDAVFNLQVYMDQLQKQVEAQEKWRDNMILLSGKVSATTIQSLMDMGAQGADLVQAMVDSNGTDLARMDDLFTRAGSDISDQFATDMDRLGVLVPAITKRFGADAAENLKTEFRNGQISVDQIMNALGATWDGKRLTMHIDANTQAAIDAAGGVVNWINRQRGTISVDAHGKIAVPGGKMLYFADGGPVDGSGPKGVDSVHAMLAPGEHVLTARDVDAFGGQAAVMRFRQSLSSMRHFADGGPVGPYPQQMPSTGTADVGGVVIYQTIYYPQAEPSSVSAIRAVRKEVG